MRLHMDKDAFTVLLEDIHSKTGYRTDVLEKDYYVVLVLWELSQLQKAGLPAYFKGGTALYKALKTTNRFSEDIDLSVDTRECSRTQSDKRLEKATKKYTSLSRDPALGRTNRSEIISVYNYDPVTAFDKEDALQRFGKLKVEATSFTISEPVEDLEISAMLYDLATEEQQKILRDVYEVAPFEVKTITMERIFVDKLFAAEAYVRQSHVEHRAFEAAKHIYDLAVIESHPKIQSLLLDENRLRRLLDIRMTEERERLDGIPGVLPMSFEFFNTAGQDENVRKAYATMQNQYVLRESDRIDFDHSVAKLSKIQSALMNNCAWKDYGRDSTPRSQSKQSVRAKIEKLRNQRNLSERVEKSRDDRDER